MKRFIVSLVFLSVVCSNLIFGQHRYLKIEDSSYFARVSLFTGVAQAFDNSADDNLQIGFRFPVWQRFHIVTNAGLRHVEPYTVMGSIGLETDIYRSVKQRAKFIVNYSRYYRADEYLLFDSKYSKTSFGIGAESMIFRRLGINIEYRPIGFYFGTRRDNPEKGNPSLTGAGEFHVNLFVALFKL